MYMIELDLIIVVILMMVNLVMLFLFFKYILMVLMILEMLIMVISYLLCMLNWFMGSEIIMLYYLNMSICESILGLMILIMVIRYYGNELYYTLNLMKF